MCIRRSPGLSFTRRTARVLLASLGLLLLAPAPRASAQTWQPAKGPLMTRWAADVNPAKTLPEYPRPQMVRPDWQNLNGLWDYAIKPRADTAPSTFDGKILVPFPIESALSGVMKKVGELNRLWYHRTFEIPDVWRGGGKHTLLHFGAVDWQATVFINGKQVGQHEGGYSPFTLDITDALKPGGGDGGGGGGQELTIAVWDPTDAGSQPRGKQVNRPSGIWYTSVTGIWQTVWLEPVPETYIESLELVPDVDTGCIKITPHVRGNINNAQFFATASFDQINLARAQGAATDPLTLTIPGATFWSPDNPHLYTLNLKVGPLNGNSEPDEVSSYFAMRKISLMNDEKGIQRICLNNKPIFQVGPLDQGWWPDGLYTAPTDEALRYDIEITKKLGFNMARKHVKVEPDRWYYWCDRLGLLVWQDMPSGSIPGGGRGARGAATQEAASTMAKEYDLELKEMIDARRNHPSIIMWVPFNEGWGQHDTERVVDWIKKYDPSRLVNNASGWTDRNVGDVHDIHVYPGPSAPNLEPTRAAVLGEFGGLGLPLAGHTWQDQANWGYRSFTTREQLTDAYVELMTKLHPLIGSPGLCAAVYTQTTDVEIEVNGLLTYDRAMVKGDADKITAANRKLFTPPPPAPVIKDLLPSSHDTAADWRYTTTQPADNWAATDFNDSAWQSGPAGFGTRSTPNTVVRTNWNTADIWIRRTFELPADLKPINPHFFIYHDEDAEVYLNGKLALKVAGYNGEYEAVKMSPEAAALLKPGKNTIAVHCHQTTGGQYIDVGIVDLVTPEK